MCSKLNIHGVCNRGWSTGGLHCSSCSLQASSLRREGEGGPARKYVKATLAAYRLQGAGLPGAALPAPHSLAVPVQEKRDSGICSTCAAQAAPRQKWTLLFTVTRSGSPEGPAPTAGRSQQREPS
ncbi:hypothetical protein NDU88_001916 [Pleurodeles waltl]|uniref:Uncharacterized protein n=1 Tax=Pleurodeles waltl TaxID=8319 RepID=A0AAV7NG56_PLEWA|nr:hypothetical protein NDU88_001916 [Pleurodeles waltl]